MAEPDEALVEKAAQALHEQMCCDGNYPCKEPVEQPYTTLARAVLAAIADDLAPAREPTVDRDALVRAIHDGLGTDYDIADAILASGVLADAAAVRAAERRAVAEEFERHCRQEAKAFCDFLAGPYADRSDTGSLNAESILGQSAGWENAANHAARIARAAAHAPDQEKP